MTVAAKRPKLPNRLRVLRAEFGLSQFDVADALGCSQSTYWLIETGRRDATEDEKDALAKLFRASVTAVFPPEAA